MAIIGFTHRRPIEEIKLNIPHPLVITDFRKSEFLGLALESLVLFGSLVISVTTMCFANPKPGLFESVRQKVPSSTRTSVVAFC
jgi:hypothetical protein